MAHSLYLLFFTGIFKCFINDPFNQLLFNVNVETQHTYVGKAGKIVGFCFVGHFGKNLLRTAEAAYDIFGKIVCQFLYLLSQYKFFRISYIICCNLNCTI